MKKIVMMLVLGLTLTACAPKATVVIVPRPNSLEVKCGTYAIAGQPFVCASEVDERTQAAVRAFAEQLAVVTGVESSVEVAEQLPATGVRFSVDETIVPEGYRLEVKKSGIAIAASTYNGFLYAMQSLRQMLPVEVFGGKPAPEVVWEVPCAVINDAPRFGYRGMHLDVSRHFFGLDEVKRYLDVMALHKLNTFHWHLTDDQGWRIEIKRYPRLTEVGSIRKETVIGKNWALGLYDGTPHGGFYTQEEVREVVAYADSLGITVIPEIDLPGHMLAALTAYPSLGCKGGKYDVWGRWGVSDEVLCPGKDSTFEFIEGVLEEVMELFPSKYIHIGGDECPKTQWVVCPKCQARIKELGLKGDDKYSAEHYLQSYVTKRVEAFVEAHGRHIIGWDEILEGELAPGATVMSWRGNDGGITAARMGHDVVMVPTTNFYFDYCQSTDTEKEPFGIGGFVSVEKVYSYDPALSNDLTPEEAKHILGVQANLWTEYIATNEHLEYMLLPRLSALSEVQWCNEETRSWQRFRDEFRMDKIFDQMGYNYAKHIFDVSGTYVSNPEKKCITITLVSTNHQPIYYTLDGSDPTEESTLYTGPFDIKESCTVKTWSPYPGHETRIWSGSYTFSKASFTDVTIKSTPDKRFGLNNKYLMVDGFSRSNVFGDGNWVGFIAEPMMVEVDLQKEVECSTVTVTTLGDVNSWVMVPDKMTVYGSLDGENFEMLGTVDAKGSEYLGAAAPVDVEVAFPTTTTRYLRIEAVQSHMPDNHIGRGATAFIFVSEIAVD